MVARRYAPTSTGTARQAAIDGDGTTLIAVMPEVTPEDLAKYNDAAIELAHDLAPGESARWADLVNTAASMGKIHNEQADDQS